MAAVSNSSSDKVSDNPPASKRAKSSFQSKAEDDHQVNNEVTFKVRIPEGVNCIEGCDVVCVVGSVPALGNWDVRSCLVLQCQASHPDVWRCVVSLPSNTTVKYRYAIIRSLMPGSLLSNGRIDKNIPISLRQWESALDPREVHVEGWGTKMEVEGIFGENNVGEKSIERGWLVGESELQIQLGSYYPEEILVGPQPCSILVTANSNNSQMCPSPVVTAKILDRSSGDCRWVEQGAIGCPFTGDNSQMIVYTLRSPSFDNIELVIDVLSPPTDPSLEPALIGRTNLLPQHFLPSNTSRRKVSLTLFSPQKQEVGTISFACLLIHPVKDGLVHTARQSMATYWSKPSRTLDIGHRGMGDSFHDEADKELNPQITENTLTSLSQAGREYGADYVEFDVQLSHDSSSHDLIPVIYHDFRVCTTPLQADHLDGFHEVFVKDLTLSQLHSLELYHANVLKPLEGSELAELKLANDNIQDLSSNAKVFPTLEEAFKSVPPEVGFNIEIKYPLPNIGSDDESFPFFDRNVMADCILKTVYLHANDRKVIFSCFDPDMCTVICLKQPKYPVLFLTTNGRDTFKEPFDVRSKSINGALMHAKAENLLGVNVDSYQILDEPSLVSHIMDKNQLVLFTWGSCNSSKENVSRQRELGVDAVIYDRIDKFK